MEQCAISVAGSNSANFFASVFLKKNLSRRKFGASVILLVISNITALVLFDSHFWSKAFAVIIVDAI